MEDLLRWQVNSPCGFGPDAAIERNRKIPLREGQGQFLRKSPEICPFENDWDPWPELSVDGLQKLLAGKRPEMMGYDLQGDDPESIVGRRIEVWWHDNGAKVYTGQITRYNKETRKHLSKFTFLLLFMYSLMLLL